MKRLIWLLALGLTHAGCAPSPDGQTVAGADNGGWTRPPLIQRITNEGATLVVSGEAEPGGRVVLRGDAGDAFATSADATGRFEVRLPARSGFLLLRPETQTGQTAAPSPDLLVLMDGGRGPTALLRPGAGARRLDAAPAIGAVDSDGRIMIVSGRVAAPARPISILAAGRRFDTAAGDDGEWSVLLPADGPTTLAVAGAAFDWPGEAGGSAGERAVAARVGQGWRVEWSGPGGARQTTWLPLAG